MTRRVGALVASGDEETARQLWVRSFASLVGLAQAKLSRMQRSGCREDTAFSVSKSFCLTASDGRFPLRKDRDDLPRRTVMSTLALIRQRSPAEIVS